MSKIARIGDTSTHGGAIVGSSSHMECRGSMVALHGDPFSCPIHGRQSCIGDTHFRMDGKIVVKVGNKVTCGATITTGGHDTNLR